MSTRCSIYFDDVTIDTFDGEKCGKATTHCHIWYDTNEPEVGVSCGDQETFYISIGKIDPLIEGLRKAKEMWNKHPSGGDE